MAPSWFPTWHPKSPKWHQKASIFIFTRPPFRRPPSKVAFGALLGAILVDFGGSLAPKLWIFKRFSAHVNEILGINLGHRFAPCYVNAFPKNITLRLPIHRTPLGRHLIKMGGYFPIGAGVVQNSARHGKNQNSSTQQRLCVGHLPTHT